MKFKTPNNLSAQSHIVARKCSYIPIFDKKTGKGSFVRKLTRGHYPRFHLYLEETQNEVIFDLHLDQSKSRYKGQTAHNADYESEEVRSELARIYSIVSTFIQKS